MKQNLKFFAGLVAALAIVALAAPSALAQCPQARSFGGFPGGKTGSQVLIDASGFQNADNEMAQFWQTGVPSNGTGVGTASSCPSQGAAPWWQDSDQNGSLLPGQRAIRGFVSDLGCTLPACPGVGEGLTFLIEDVTADGLGTGFIMYSVDETPAGARWYDTARTDPNAAAGSSLVHTMFTLPTVTIQGSAGPPPNTTATSDYPDVGVAFHGVTGPLNTPVPALDLIDSYDLMACNTSGPCSRNRSDWSLVKSIPYLGTDIISDSALVPCPAPPGDLPTLLAIGLTVNGGVESDMVGPPSLEVICDPNVAQPDVDTPKVRRPSFTSRPGRSGR